MLERLRKVAHWLGLENEHRLFSWRLALLVVGLAAVLGRPDRYTAGVAIAALVVHLWEGARSQERNRIAMKTANEQAKEKMQCEGRVSQAIIQAETEKAKLAAEVELKKARAERMKALDDFKVLVDAISERVRVIEKSDRFAQLQEQLRQKLGVPR